MLEKYFGGFHSQELLWFPRTDVRETTTGVLRSPTFEYLSLKSSCSKIVGYEAIFKKTTPLIDALSIS